MKFKHIRTGAILEPHSDFVLEMAQEAGIAVPDGAKKAEIIDLIEALKQN